MARITIDVDLPPGNADDITSRYYKLGKMR